MALYTTLASLSQTAASNVSDGSTDAPSTIDQQANLLASFIAQLRDGAGLTTGVGYLAQCRLTKSGTNLLLSRFNGIGLTINGVPYAIPAAGVTLAPTALVAGTLYYIYAYMNAGVMTLEASTTGHATDTTTGIEIQSGNPTRTLVGMARVITGPAWQDIAGQRFVSSWFNRRPIVASQPTSALGPYASTITEGNGNDRTQFLTWAGDAIDANLNVRINGGATVSFSAIYLDNNPATSSPVFQTSAGFFSASPSLRLTTPSEGYHFIAFWIGTNSGVTSQWLGNDVNSAVIQG